MHYPLMYVLYAYVWNNTLTLADAWPQAAVVVSSIVLAWLVMRYYDRPVRAWLSAKFL